MVASTMKNLWDFTVQLKSMHCHILHQWHSWNQDWIVVLLQKQLIWRSPIAFGGLLVSNLLWPLIERTRQRRRKHWWCWCSEEPSQLFFSTCTVSVLLLFPCLPLHVTCALWCINPPLSILALWPPVLNRAVRYHAACWDCCSIWPREMKIGLSSAVLFSSLNLPLASLTLLLLKH